MVVIVCFCKRVSKYQDSVAKMSFFLENAKSTLIPIYEKSQADRRQRAKDTVTKERINMKRQLQKGTWTWHMTSAE